MDGARFAQERGAEGLEHAVNRQQSRMETLHRSTVIGPVAPVLAERHRKGHLVRHPAEARRAAKRCNQIPELRVKLRHRRGTEGKAGRSAVAAGPPQRVIDKIEGDLDARPVRDQRGGQAARRDVERGIPGMIEPRGAGEPVLPRDLQVKMQGRTGLAPAQILQLRPVLAHLRILLGSHAGFDQGSARAGRCGQALARPQARHA